MTEYMIPENREAPEWRFDDQGLIAGPYSYHELKEFVELDYILPETEIVHDDGRKCLAFEIGLFPGFVIEKTDSAQEYRNAVLPLPGWNFLAGVATLSLLINMISGWIPGVYWFQEIRVYLMIIGGFALVLIGCYTGLTGIAHDYSGTPLYRPVFHRVGAVIAIIFGTTLGTEGIRLLLFGQ